MAERGKTEPSLTPPEPSLAVAVRRALDDPAVRRDIRVSLRVAGGAPGQTYALQVRASGDESADAELRAAAPREREARAERARISNDQFAELLRRIVDSKVLESSTPPPRFLPDTLVGYFEVARGDSVYQAYFAADPEQARTQNAVPPPELQRAVDALYRVGASLLGQKSVRAIRP